MRRLTLALIATALLFAAWPGPLAAQTDAADAAEQALDWIRGQQQADGSFPGFGPGESADAAVAFAAAGEDPAAVKKGGKSALDYLQAQAATYAATGPGAIAKLVLAAVAAGEDPAAFGGLNLLEELGKSYDPASGQYGPDVYGHALAMIAIRSVGASPSPAAVARLVSLQLEDGGWSFDGTADTGSDTNTTSLALQALAGQRQVDGARGKAVAYLQGQQNDDGGFPYSQSSQFGNDSDANSTAAVIQGLLAAGQRPDARQWTKGGNTPAAALAALQNDSGAMRFQAGQADDNALATYQAVPALLGKALPVVTSTVRGAADLVAPATASAPAGLPATGAGDTAPAAAALLAGILLLALGAAARRAARA